jgi:hypothetical protein
MHPEVMKNQENIHAYTNGTPAIGVETDVTHGRDPRIPINGMTSPIIILIKSTAPC